MPTLRVASAIAIVGTAVHDVVEFGRPSGQNTLPVVLIVSALVVVIERSSRWRPLAKRLLAAFAVVMLIGGAVASVLPLPIWPFDPEQSISHYASHAVWAASLLPLLMAAAPSRTGGRAAAT